MKMYSCERVGLSFTLSGIALGLCQIISLRRYQPSACKANASRHGTPSKSLSFSPGGCQAELTLRDSDFSCPARASRDCRWYIRRRYLARESRPVSEFGAVPKKV